MSDRRDRIVSEVAYESGFADGYESVKKQLAALTAENERLTKALERIDNDCPPLSDFTKRNRMDIESFEESRNYYDVAIAASYRDMARIGDIARDTLAEKGKVG